MSEAGKKIISAAQVVENSLAAAVRDLESGIGSFFSGSHAKTHEPAPVRESSSQEREKQGDTFSQGQIIASQDIGGTPYYLVQTENPKGGPEKVLFEKGDTNYQAGTDVSVKWGTEDKPVSAQTNDSTLLLWSSNFAGQSQFSSTHHQESDYGI